MEDTTLNPVWIGPRCVGFHRVVPHRVGPHRAHRVAQSGLGHIANPSPFGRTDGSQTTIVVTNSPQNMINLDLLKVRVILKIFDEYNLASRVGPLESIRLSQNHNFTFRTK